MNNDNSSISGPMGFNARVSSNHPTQAPIAPRVEPTPKHAGYKTSHRDLTPSEAPVLDLPSAGTIANGVAAALHRHDRQQAQANGDEHYDARQLLSTLAAEVKAGRMSNEAANTAFSAVFPTLRPENL